jgi:hypothetical protein
MTDMPNHDEDSKNICCDACVYEPYSDWIRANGRLGKCPIHGPSTTVTVRALSTQVDKDFRDRYERAERGGSDWEDLVRHEMTVCEGTLIADVVAALPSLAPVNTMAGDECFYHGNFKRK